MYTEQAVFKQCNLALHFDEHRKGTGPRCKHGTATRLGGHDDDAAWKVHGRRTANTTGTNRAGGRAQWEL